MRITHLTLRNWRTFKNLDVEVGQRLVIIGPNASGKSNLLDSIRFLRDLASIFRRGGLGVDVCAGQRVGPVGCFRAR